MSASSTPLDPPVAQSTHVPIYSGSASESLTAVARAVAKGNLAIVPTETVYGVMVNLLSPTARSAARAMKQVPAGTSPGWVLHLPRIDEVFKWVPSLTGVGKRLITKTLPGPVAFQIELTPADAKVVRERLQADKYPDIVEEVLGTFAKPTLTIRVPENHVTANMLEKAGVPVAIFAARGTADGVAHEISELATDILGNETSAVIDGGATRYRKASTLVRISTADGEGFHVVRSGVIDGRIIEKFADEVILFVCSGNTCRSPMAMALARKVLAERHGVQVTELPLRHIVVQSAGVSTGRGMRATREAVEAVKDFGGDLTTHQSQPASIDLLRRADVIYTMTNAHRQEVLRLLPSAASKTSRLNPAADIDDPIGSDLSVYKEVAEGLLNTIRKRLTK